MKSLRLVMIVCCAFWFLNSCDREIAVAPAPEIAITESELSDVNGSANLAMEVVNSFNWQIEMDDEVGLQVDVALQKKGKGGMKGFERIPIDDDIVHYRMNIQVGPGQYDVIGLHRVVKESRKNHPIKTKRTFFYQHGDAKDFAGMMLPGTLSPNTPDDFGLAVYLAKKNVDVWGIDQAWTLVPEGETNFDFMADWGIQRQVDDLNTAISVARFVRAITGNGVRKMILCGYSSGVATGYALLNQETQLHRRCRQVSGYIPVDLAILAEDGSYWQQVFEGDYYLEMDLINNGIYQLDIPFKPVGFLARTDPDGASPIFPGFTNLQVSLFYGGGQVFGDGVNFHYLGNYLDNGFPAAFRFISNEKWYDFLESAPPFEPVLFIAEYDALISGVIDLPFDDHFAEIKVPIFNVGAGGGFGEDIIYGTTFLGSTDITHHIASINGLDPLEDFGHIDIFTANEAKYLAWKPIYNWIKSHSH